MGQGDSLRLLIIPPAFPHERSGPSEVRTSCRSWRSPRTNRGRTSELVRVGQLSYTCTMPRTYDRWYETHCPTALDWNGLQGYVLVVQWTEDGPQRSRYPNPPSSVLTRFGNVPTGLLRGMWREEYRETIARIHALSSVDTTGPKYRNYRMMRSAGFPALDAYRSLDDSGHISDDSEWWPENRDESDEDDFGWGNRLGAWM